MVMDDYDLVVNFNTIQEIYSVARNTFGMGCVNLLINNEKLRKDVVQYVIVHVNQRGIVDKMHRAGLIAGCISLVYKKWLTQVDSIDYYLS
jgi:hypothetical protein